MTRVPPYWFATKDGDKTCLQLYERHYSAYQYKDGRKRRIFAGPGEKFVLRTASGDAFFVWRRFRDACIDQRTGMPQQGINCAAFRNEGTHVSSELIRQADEIAFAIWSDSRHYTYVNQKNIRSSNPGFCFLRAGWRKCGYTKGGLIVMELVRGGGGV